MMNVSPVITRETTIWRVWLGLNASLSLGLILFGSAGRLSRDPPERSPLSLDVLACTWPHIFAQLYSRRKTLLFLPP